MHEKIETALKKLGINRLTEIQELAFKPIYDGRNCILISPTGTGKTLAALLPIFQRWLEEKPKPTSILYISPMKALNRDQEQHLSFWAKELGMEISVRHGDTSSYERKLQAEFPNDFLILTIEALQSVLVGKKIREHLKNVKWVILDEVHEIIESKRGVQLTLALERLRELSQDFQIIMLSATVAEPEKVARFFCSKKVEIINVDYDKPMDIKVVFPREEKIDEKTVEKIFVSKDTLARLKFIIEKLKESKSTLIFTNTREFAEILASRLKAIDKNLPISVHHSSLSKEVRIKTENEFKRGLLKALVCTSSLQLGIDIGTVDLVIQYQSPREVTQLLQRIGRSGHKFWEQSKGIIIATDEEDVLESAVIARKALAKELEKLSIHSKNYDVLAHQIVGIAFDFGKKIEIEKVYNIVKRAHPYENLKKDELLDVIKILEGIGILKLEDTKIVLKRKAYDYYFSQLSTIPDVKEYKVINIADGNIIGTLDENFVALYGEEDSVFILKGDAYRIVSMEEDKIYVEETTDKDAAVPSWVGELVPVSLEVATEVSKLRKMLSEDRIDDNTLENLYRIDSRCIPLIKSFYREAKKKFVPSENEIFIEYFDNKIIIHSSFGNKVNETLAKLISSKLFKVFKNKNDAYRIIFVFPEKVNKDLAEKIKYILETFTPKDVEIQLKTYLSDTDLYVIRFINVAKRFGIIEKDSSLSLSLARKLAEGFKNTPIHEEVINEIMVDKLDVQNCKNIIEKILKKEIKINVVEGPSKISDLALRKIFLDYIEAPTEDIIKKFKERILERKVKLICINCGDWRIVYTLKDLPENVRCGNCGARLITVVRENEVGAERLIRKYIQKSKLNKTEKEELNKLFDRASLYLSFGKKLAISLSVRFIGLETAKKILSKYFKNDEEFFEELYKAYRNSIKTKKYWKI